MRNVEFEAAYAAAQRTATGGRDNLPGVPFAPAWVEATDVDSRDPHAVTARDPLLGRRVGVWTATRLDLGEPDAGIPPALLPNCVLCNRPLARWDTAHVAVHPIYPRALAVGEDCLRKLRGLAGSREADFGGAADPELAGPRFEKIVPLPADQVKAEAFARWTEMKRREHEVLSERARAVEYYQSDKGNLVGRCGEYRLVWKPKTNWLMVYRGEDEEVYSNSLSALRSIRVDVGGFEVPPKARTVLDRVLYAHLTGWRRDQGAPAPKMPAAKGVA